jgi:gliding motility-associated-like protein
VPSGSYIVTVTDSNHCTATVQAVVGQLAGPSVVVTGEPEICSRNNGSAIATASGGHGAPYTYSWSNGQITQKDTGLGGQTYTVTISDGGCIATNSLNIYNIPGPNAYFIYNPKVLNILDGPVYFQDQSTGTVINWQWSLGDGDTTSGTPFWHQYHAIGSYPVIEVVTDTNGCKDTIVDTVIVKDIFTFYIPNAFTPNNDSKNDLFSPKGSNVDPNNFNEYIYDRWGNLIFHTNEWDLTTPPSGQAKGWNGTVNNSGGVKNVVMDVYVYKIILREFNNGPEHEYIGSITLVP